MREIIGVIRVAREREREPLEPRRIGEQLLGGHRIHRPYPAADGRNVGSIRRKGVATFRRWYRQAWIEPDDATKRQTAAAGKIQLVTSFEICADERGEVMAIEQLLATGYREYDADLVDLIWTWRYRPYEVNHKIVRVCTAVTFQYPPRLRP